MNVRMWEHAATQRNLATLEKDGILTCGPNEGEMACGEFGFGRMAEPLEIVAAIEAAVNDGPLKGRHILVTSGPTHELIDPVRYIANRSSGAQGTAIARALLGLGARVTFVSGPSDVAAPMGVDLVKVQTAAQMLDAVQAVQDVDVGVFVAAVADWGISNASDQKIKKDGKGFPVLEFFENPDILATVCASKNRPDLVVGFAAETQNVVENATAKRKRKGCDWIVANDVSPSTGIMGGSENDVVLITAEGQEDWPRMGKDQVAQRLAQKIAVALG
jgi:phosphopantothenoylcysteine decarboxylase/phosphopantothenate--cysteine ligase